MNRILLLFIIPLFICCSTDNDEIDTKEIPQDHTSFIFTLNEYKEFKYTNCIAAYFDERGYCIKLADVGEVSKNNISKEIRVTIDTLTRVYLFVNIENEVGDILNLLRVEKPFMLKTNYKNVFNLADQPKLINVTESLKEYPH